jgi:hypothetical protein
MAEQNNVGVPDGREKHVSYGRTVSVEVPIPVAGGAYDALDVIGGLLSVNDPTIPRKYWGIHLLGLTVNDLDKIIKPSLAIVIFDAAPAVVANNAPYVLQAVDKEKRKKKITIDTGLYETEDDFSYADKCDFTLPIDMRRGKASTFFFYVYPTAAYAPTLGLSANFTFWID